MVRRVLGITACVVLLPACDQGRSSEAVDSVPSVRLQLETSIGGLDEARPEYEFGRVSGLAPLPNGGVAVVDAAAHVVRVFGDDGLHRYDIGRPGEGPGELGSPCCAAVDRAQRLWVRDGGNARYNVYRLHPDSAAFLFQVRMAHSDTRRHAPVTFDAAGNLVDVGLAHHPQTGTRSIVRTHVDSAGTVIDAVAMHAVPADSTAMKQVQRPTANGSETRYAYQPFGPEELTAHAPNGEYAHAVSSRYDIDWRDARGDLIRHISRDLPIGPRLSDAERQRGEDQIASQLEFVGVARGQLGFDVPGHKTPLRNLFFDRDGRLWVELNTADGTDRTAHVYHADGTLDRVMHWPANVDLTHGAVEGDVAWGVLRDELDVPSVVKLSAR